MCAPAVFCMRFFLSFLHLSTAYLHIQTAGHIWQLTNKTIVLTQIQVWSNWGFSAAAEGMWTHIYFSLLNVPNRGDTDQRAYPIPL